MAHDSGLWTWPADTAVENSRVEWLVAASFALYVVGALLLLAPPAAASVGALMMLLSVAGSMMVLGKVMLARNRDGAR